MEEAPETKSVTFREMKVGQAGRASGGFYPVVVLSVGGKETFIKNLSFTTPLNNVPVIKVVFPDEEGKQVPCLEVLVSPKEGEALLPSGDYFVPEGDDLEIKIEDLKVSRAE